MTQSVPAMLYADEDAADASFEQTDEAEVFDAETCRLFANDEIPANDDVLLQPDFVVEQNQYDITVTHSRDWSEPGFISFAGLQLVATIQEPEEQMLAVVRLEHGHEGQGCSEGFYALHAEDTIGAEARVLVVLDGVVLVEHNDELHYLLVSGHEEPQWRMIWRSPWDLVMPSKYSKQLQHVRPPARRKTRPIRRR